MTAVWETRKRHMPVPGARELLPKRRESDEQRVGERFGKVTRVELVGCRQQGEPNLEQERRIEKAGKVKGQGPRTHSGARTLKGENLGLGEPVRAEGIQG